MKKMKKTFWACQLKQLTSLNLCNYGFQPKRRCKTKYVLKYGSGEKVPSFCKCSILLGFIMSKKQERLRSELLSEDKITNLLVFLT